MGEVLTLTSTRARSPPLRPSDAPDQRSCFLLRCGLRSAGHAGPSEDSAPDPAGPNPRRDPCALPGSVLTMVPSCSRGGLEWTWARGTRSRRAGPVRPLSSSGVRTDMTTRLRPQTTNSRSPRSGSQNGCASRNFRSWKGQETATRKYLESDARIHLSTAPGSFWRVPRNSQSMKPYHRWAEQKSVLLAIPRLQEDLSP